MRRLCFYEVKEQLFYFVSTQPLFTLLCLEEEEDVSRTGFKSVYFYYRVLLFVVFPLYFIIYVMIHIAVKGLSNLYITLS